MSRQKPAKHPESSSSPFQTLRATFPEQRHFLSLRAPLFALFTKSCPRACLRPPIPCPLEPLVNKRPSESSNRRETIHPTASRFHPVHQKPSLREDPASPSIRFRPVVCPVTKAWFSLVHGVLVIPDGIDSLRDSGLGESDRTRTPLLHYRLWKRVEKGVDRSEIGKDSHGTDRFDFVHRRIGSGDGPGTMVAVRGWSCTCLRAVSVDRVVLSDSSSRIGNVSGGLIGSRSERKFSTFVYVRYVTLIRLHVLTLHFVPYYFIVFLRRI